MTIEAVRVIPCEEFGVVDVPLTDVLGSDGTLRMNPEIEAKGYFAVSLKSRTISLRASGFIGYIPLTDDIVVNVRPRVPVSNMTHIVAASGHRPAVLTSLRTYAPSDNWSDLFIDLYAESLDAQLNTVAELGLLQEYVEREEITSFPRGRINTSRTLTTLVARNIHHKAQTSWWDKTPDVAVNQTILMALELLSHHYTRNPPGERHGKRLVRRLNAHRLLFSGVSLDRRQRFLSHPMVDGRKQLPSSRAYYAGALALARDIVTRRSVLIEGSAGLTTMPSMVVDMATVFELYVRHTLQSEADRSGSPYSVLDGNVHPASKNLYTEHASPRATPDILLRAPNGRNVLVGEVKNVPVSGPSDRKHVEQALGYALTYGCDHVFLIHPCSSAAQSSGLRQIGTIGHVAVYQYLYDLGADDLQAEGEKYAQEILTLATAVDPAAATRQP